MFCHLFLLLGICSLVFGGFTAATHSPITLPPKEYPCPEQGGVYGICSLTTVYIVDSSNDLTSSEINDEYDWIRYNIIPGTDWDMHHDIGFMEMSGGDMSYAALPKLKNGCDELEELQQSWKQHGSRPSSVYDAMQTVKIYYSAASTVVLFSATQNLTDINQAATFVKANMTDKKITVVALKGANFAGFPGTIYNIPSLNPAPLNLQSCVIKSACDQGVGCNPNSVPDVPVYWPTHRIPKAESHKVEERQTKKSDSWIYTICSFFSL